MLPRLISAYSATRVSLYHATGLTFGSLNVSRFHHANTYFDMRALQHTTSRCRKVATLALRVLWRIKLMGGSSQVISIGIYHTICFIHVHNRLLLPLPKALGNHTSSNAYVQPIRRQRLCRGDWS